MESEVLEVEQEKTILGEGLGNVLFIDDDDKKFYGAFQTVDLVVKVGDCVRVALESDNSNDTCVTYGFAQVLAIFINKLEELMIEVRWFQQPHEISPQIRKKINPDDNELIETDELDDIAAGAVSEIINIKGSNIQEIISTDYFICRYYIRKDSSAIQKVIPQSLFIRGMELSHYIEAYKEFLKSSSANFELDDYSIAIQRLHLSVIPEVLPCRESERKAIEDFIRKSISVQQKSSPFYICGIPGSGKTATVLSSINNLRKEVASGKIPDFNFIDINCLKLKSPADAYTQLWRGLTGEYLASKSALKRLDTFFTSQLSSRTISVAPKNKLVCLMDELDFLMTKEFKVIYNFFEWAASCDSSFLLIGIANTMDMPERIAAARVESRTPINIQRLSFNAYTHDEIKLILKQRLEELKLEVFDSRVIEFISRIAASSAGDLRAALHICQTTIELYREKVTSNKDKNFKPSDSKFILSLVREAADRYKQAPFIAVSSTLCWLDKAILYSMFQYIRIATGGDDNGSVASMTSQMIWARLEDFVKKIETDRFFSSTNGVTTNINSISENSNITIFLKTIKLSLPPRYIFQQAINRLVEKSILLLSIQYNSKAGIPTNIYRIHQAFNYSDFVASLNPSNKL